MSVPVNARTIYECPPGKLAVIEHFVFCSTHTGSESFRLHHVRQDEAASIHNSLFYDYSLSAKSYLSVEGVFYLTQGERLICSAGGADRITITIYGQEV